MVEIVKLCKGLLGYRRIPRIVKASTLALGLSLVCSVALADTGDGFLTDYLNQTANCKASFNDTGSDGTRCLLGNSLTFLLDKGLEQADAAGKLAFGPHFQVMGDLTSLPGSSEFGILGDIDVVLPFAGTASSGTGQGNSSFFFQHGVTRWQNGSDTGLFRNDFRGGVVRRFRVSNAPDAGILGLSVFHLTNVEYGHTVVVPGFEYATRWGTGSVHYFIPTTGWRPARHGFEERALEGVEVGMRFDLTTTVSLNTAGYRWQAEDGSDRWNTGARFDIDWRPHPWLKFGAGHDGIGRSERFAEFTVALQIPLWSPSKRPPWEGLGVVSYGSDPTTADLWAPVSNVNQIGVATRETSETGSSVTSDDVTVTFLDDSAGTGGEVRLEVSLSTPAVEDVRVEVLLVPGSGDNPAVPGVDFVDEPVEVTIRQGTKSSRVTIQLLENEALQESRSLNATASIVS